MHDDRSRLREALAAALAAAQDARAPERVIVLLQGAYRSLESSHFVDAEMIRWAEASLGAWRRWSATRKGAEHRLLVVDATSALGVAVRTAVELAALGTVRVVETRTAILEALATHLPTVIVFDLDAELAPTSELLAWLSTEFPQIRRIGCTASVDTLQQSRDRALFHAIIPRPPTAATLRHALLQAPQKRTSLG
jgi:hypothetical protein